MVSLLPSYDRKDHGKSILHILRPSSILYKFNNINLQSLYDKDNNMIWWMIEITIVFISIVTENLKRRLPNWQVLERLFRNWNINWGNEYIKDLLGRNWTLASLWKPATTKARD